MPSALVWLIAALAGCAAPETPTSSAADAALDAGPDRASDASSDAANDASHDVASDALAADAAAQASAAAAWCAQWAAATCALWTTCPLAAAGQPLQGCAARLTQQCQGGPALAQALQAKALAFDPTQGKQCLEGLAKLGCATLLQALTSPGQTAVAACAKVWQGLVPAGGPCVLGSECQGGARCVFGAQCPGQCQAWSALGAPCSDGQPCDPAVARCSAGLCVALPAKPGDPCPAGECAAPLYCSGSGTCAAFGLDGAPCATAGPLCWPGLGCWAVEGQQGTCKPVGGPGSPCLGQANCGALGADAPLLCVAGSCQAAPGPGKPCFDWQCQKGWCDSQAKPPTCVAWPAPGQPCPQGWCGPAAVCAAGVCQVALAEGQACSDAGQCQSGQCVKGLCSAAGVSPCL